jgi:MurNAc alpha-1-phosphate uridylyltransferase
MTVESAMVLAAGLGTRMQPLTRDRPKPLIEVAGRSLIDRAVDALVAAGVRRVVVNKHYLPDQVEAWARSRGAPLVAVQDETAQLLDTGGGVARALPVLGPAPFFVLNSDSFWVDGPDPALARMQRMWDPEKMDCLLLLADRARSTGFDGPGDFNMDQCGRLSRRSGETAPLVYAGAYLVHPRIFADAPGGAFSMNVLWNRAIAEGRLFGVEHEGWWLHVGTPEAIPLAEEQLARLGAA